MNNEQLTKNFKLEEFLINNHDIDLKPNFNEILNLKLLCLNVLQPLRDNIDNPIIITSGFRNKELNKIVHGANNSQHLTGQACDFICDNLTEAYQYIRRNLTYDELILYVSDSLKTEFIHVSFNNKQNDKETMICKQSGLNTNYFLYNRRLFNLIENANSCQTAVK